MIYFLKEHFPHIELRSVEEVIGNNELKVTVANQGVLDVKGIAILNFGVEKEQNLFHIPFLVTSEKISNIIIGYNTVEHLVTNF